MIIYDNVRKNIKIAIYSEQNDILDVVTNELENREFKCNKYNDKEKLALEIKNKKLKILLYIKSKEDVQDIKELVNTDVKAVVFNKENIDFDILENELCCCLSMIENEDKIDYEKYKLEIVGNLVESISHKVQANLLILGASQDIIKIYSSDLEKNDQKKEILESLYDKNAIALQNSNILLQLVSSATDLSSESIMHSSDIKEIIEVILDECIKKNTIRLNITENIKVGSYICGPLNDVIFIICKIIKQFIEEFNENIDMLMYEDEYNWYFTIKPENAIVDLGKYEQIRKFTVYIKNVMPKFNNQEFTLIIKKVK